MNLRDVLTFGITLTVIAIFHRLLGLRFDSAEALILAATNVILLAIRERAK